jgi:DNA-binding response OmpR family regulator
VPKTLLAIDDSTTMRKVLEITFAGEDFRVVATDSSQNALASMSEGPVAAVVDTALDASDGYALAKELRARDPRLAIVLLSSRYNPYDANRAREAGADDYADKPFDTQALIDKVKKAIVARESAKYPVPSAAVPAPPPPAPQVVAPMGNPPRAPPAPTGVQRPGASTQRTHTLSFEGAPSAGPPIARTAPSGTPIVQPQQIRPAAPPPPPSPAIEHMVRTAVPPRPAEAAPAAAAGTNGHLAIKLGELGLTAQQVDAVLALSREVIERVVWEVVPQLAETLIKEEISRLTKDG